MNAVQMLKDKQKGPSLVPLLAGAAVSLVLSSLTLVSNQFYLQLRDLTQTLQGGNIFDLFIVGGCFMMLLVAFLDRSKVVYAHYLSGMLYAPSVLALSQADWLGAAGFKGGFSAFRSTMSVEQLLVIGLIILALFLFHFSLTRSGRIADELRKAGGEEREINAAVDRLVLNRVWTIILAVVGTLVIYGVIAGLGPWLGAQLARSPGAFVAVLAGAAVSALALFVYLLRSKTGSEVVVRESGDKQ